MRDALHFFTGGFLAGLAVFASIVGVVSQDRLDNVIGNNLSTYTDQVECVKDTNKPCDLVTIKMYMPIN